jgi:hypothetical protein
MVAGTLQYLKKFSAFEVNKVDARRVPCSVHGSCGRCGSVLAQSKLRISKASLGMYFPAKAVRNELRDATLDI